MFDSSSRTLLKSAPELPNLDPATIDELLTSAYIELATIRVNSQQASIGPTQELFDRVRRMATTFEAYVALNLRPDQMRSAAFVAATAHRILAGFREARTPDGQKDDPSNLLSKYAISSSISAAILFLIADRSADAAEASLAIDGVSEKNAIRRSLVFSIREFATGRLVTLVERNIPQEFDRREDSDEQATDLLYRECIYALKDLAGEAYSATAPEIDIKERLNNVISLSEAVSYNLDELPGVVYRQFAGPHHLAVLLRSLIDGARDAMLVNVPTPLAANPIEWKKWLAFQAKSRPFLWINHIKAIRTGYLDRGQSMVMTSPTGSGKTTLSVLKIVSTLCAGDSVIYLAPTHALVEQVESDFSGYIKDLKPVNLEEAVIEELGEQLPAFSVMTPERCLALLGFAPALFAKVGLLVFDEFHLIGAEDPELSARVNTRAIDAMIALLSFIGRCPKADLLLLSAMVSNGDEVAAWLSQVKSEKVSAFNDPWKPTRQLRSCVIYDVEEVEAALILAAGQATKEARGKPLVTPLGLFSLISAWHPSQTEKLIVKSLTDRAPALVVNKYGSITANRNEVAAQIAVDYAKAGKKVIVFCSDIKACGSVSDRVNSLLFAANVPLNEEQQSILSAIVSDVGSKEAAFTPDSKRAGVHHGDLLPMERKLTEMLFRQRPEPGSDRRGLEVIAATSTIAQGLNLPCDVVILAGTDRSSVDDFSESPRTDLRPHEILNALGRAGRASYSATGLSIVVPAKPIRVNLGKIDVGREQILKTVFSEGDACEKIFDPIEILLDQVDSSANMDAKAQAMIRRLCSETVDGKSGFEEIVTRSFGYYRKCRDDKAGAEKWVESRRSALKAAEKGLADPEIMDWQYEIAVRNGMPPRFIVQLANAIENFHLDFNHTSGWIGWLLDVIAENPSDLEIFVRESSLESVFGRAYKAGGKSSENAVVILQSLKTLTEMWCSGFTLTEIEDWILKFIHQYEGDVKKKASKSKSAQRARRFAIRITPDLGFLCGVFAQVAAHVIQDQQLNVSRIEMLPQMIKMGDHDWHHMALRQRGAGASRVDSYLSFERLRPYFTADASSDMTAIRRDVNRARTLLPELDGDI